MISPKEYVDKLVEVLSKLNVEEIEAVVRALDEVRSEGRRVFVCGNGGSAATASHFVNDLNKLASVGMTLGFQAMCLSDNTPLLTAWSNDVDYSECFTSQMRNFFWVGDMLIGISVSGNSPNVVRAVEMARSSGGVTVGMLGEGGKVGDMVDHKLLVPEKDYGRVEDAHMILCHIITSRLASNE